MLKLKQAFRELIPKHFNFLQEEHDFKFEGFKFDDDYKFLYEAAYSNEILNIFLLFDEREGYFYVMLSPKNYPRKQDSLYRLLEKVEPPFDIKLQVTEKKLEIYREMFGEYVDEKTIEDNVSQFIFNKIDLNDYLSQYAHALKKNFNVIVHELMA